MNSYNNASCERTTGKGGQPKMLTLYHHNISVCAQKVRIALDEKRIPWQGREVDLMKGSTSPLNF